MEIGCRGPLWRRQIDGGSGGRLSVARLDPADQRARRGRHFNDGVTAFLLRGCEPGAAEQDDEGVTGQIAALHRLGVHAAQRARRIKDIDSRLLSEQRQRPIASLGRDIEFHCLRLPEYAEQAQSEPDPKRGREAASHG